MVLCRICIEQLNNPVSLPCGHIFCTNCIVKAIRAVKHFTNFHHCPICRSIYNIAPVNLKMVPPNLRSFVTPSIRQLYIDSHSPEEEEEENIMPIASTSSEISRLQAENHALHSHCTMWRRRADMQGSANLNLVKLIQTIQNQASQLAQERNELDRRFSWLKRKLDDHESWTPGNVTRHEWPVETEAFLEPPPPLTSSLSTHTSPTSFLPSFNIPQFSSRHFIDEAMPPRKRPRIDSQPSRTQAILCARSAAERIAIRQKEVLAFMHL